MAETDNDILEDADDSDIKTDIDIEQKTSLLNRVKGLFGKLKFNFTKRNLIIIGIVSVVLIALIIGAFFMFSSDEDDITADDTIPVEETVVDTPAEPPSVNILDPEVKEESPKDDTKAEEEVATESTESESGPAKRYEGDRLGAISDSVKASGMSFSDDSTPLNLTTDVTDTNTVLADPELDPNIEPLPEMDELTKLKIENEALKKKLDKAELERIRLDYIVRTNDILETHAGPIKQKVEQPLDIELAPKWGDFKDNAPKQ